MLSNPVCKAVSPALVATTNVFIRWQAKKGVRIFESIHAIDGAQQAQFFGQ
jgi:hypothetical protein